MSDVTEILSAIERGDPSGAADLLPLVYDELRTVCFDKTARLWDLTSPDPASSWLLLPGHTGALGQVAISPDGHWAVTGGEDRAPRVWDLTADNPASSPLVLRGHKSIIKFLGFSWDSR